MRTSKIITTIAALNLVLFMSIATIAKPVTKYEGDIVKSGVKKQIETVKTTIAEIASNTSSYDEFSHLRFDVNNFNSESGNYELPLNSLDYLQFDANTFSGGITSEITELPVMNEFDYLRFEVTSFNTDSDFSEMPVNELGYLRFDCNKFSTVNPDSIEEMPSEL